MAHAIGFDESDLESRLQKSFDDAWRTDLALIRQITLEEQQEEADRIYAASLAGVTLDKISDDIRKAAMLEDDLDDDDDDNKDDEDDEDEQTKNTIYRVPDDNNHLFAPTTGVTSNHTKKKKCAWCMETLSRTDVRLPCNHKCCSSCVKELFLKSMQDETLMPPRCCRQEIPIHLAKLTPKEINDFNDKQLEFSTKDRLYCSRPFCSAFIPPARIINDVGTCPRADCREKTCSRCKAASHGNLECPKDEATAAVLDAARKEGWTRCYQCRAVIELAHGCFHMTCRCRAEFCYLCTVPWKNCKCPQWDEQRLYREARARTARIPAVEILRGDGRANVEERIQHMADLLRANHECRHTRGWAYTRGGGRCEECRHYLPQYLFRCYTCNLMVCNRCRRNRL